jgi:hypothetical protein
VAAAAHASAPPFKEDYPTEPRTDGTGQLTHTIDGHPLVGRFVAGRKEKDGPDVGLKPEQYDDLMMALIGQRALDVPGRMMRGDAIGITRYNSAGRPLAVWLNRDMNPLDRTGVYGHELGHVIHRLAGARLDIDDLMEELRPLYNTLTNPNRTSNGVNAVPGRMMSPADFGYSGDQVKHEYVAEAFSAYLTDPNYIKSVAPKTAARIREWINTHPSLAPTIQLNSLQFPKFASVEQLGDQS